MAAPPLSATLLNKEGRDRRSRGCAWRLTERQRRGNIRERRLGELVGCGDQLRFGRDKLDRLPCYCLACDVRFACHGGCPKDRIVGTPDDEPGLSFLCPGFKAFFHHVDAPMKRMCELLRHDRAPGEIMAEYGLRDGRDGDRRGKGRRDASS